MWCRRASSIASGGELWYSSAALSGPQTGEINTVSQGDARAAGRGILLVVAGPSGVGKGTLIRGLRQRQPQVRFSVSCTTREPRPGETDGEDYHFVSHEEFARMRRDGELLEWAVVHDNSYGTPRVPVEQALQAGHDMVLEIDYQGARSVREALPEAVLVFVAPPDVSALLERLGGRNTESSSALARRLRSARTEFKHIGMFDYLIVNDELGPATDALEAIYLAERLRTTRADRKSLQQRLLDELEGGPRG